MPAVAALSSMTNFDEKTVTVTLLFGNVRVWTGHLWPGGNGWVRGYCGIGCLCYNRISLRLYLTQAGHFNE